MYYLIKKDLLVQKYNLLISLLIVLTFTIAFANLGPVGLSLSIFAVSYILIMGAASQDDRTNGDMLLQSLPIKKSTIVSSKYVSVYVFAAFAILLNMGVIGLIRLLKLPIPIAPFSLEGVYGSLIPITLFSAVSFPLIFKWGYLKAKAVNYFLTFVFAFIFGATPLLNRYFQGSPLSIQTEAAFKAGLILGLFLLLVLSYILSLSFYKKREF